MTAETFYIAIVAAAVLSVGALALPRLFYRILS